MKKLKVFEAFAGVGSQSMALRNIGVNYEVVGIMDVDRYALLSYDAIHNDVNQVVKDVTKEDMLEEVKTKNIAYNFSTGKSEIPRNENDLRKLYNAHIRNKNYGDIRLVNENNLPDFDFFTYSFPCKNISNAGQQAGFEEGSGTQSALVWECKRIIKAKNPKYLMMENVKNLVGKNHKDLFDLWCKTLEELGYNNYWKVLNGKDFGVPQNRQRVIMISIKKNVDDCSFVMPTGECKQVKIKDILVEDVEDKFYMNKPFVLVKKGHQAEFLNMKHDESKRIYSSENNTMRCLKSKDRGQNNILIRAKLQHKGSDQSKRVMDIEGVSGTIDAMLGGNRQPKILELSKKDVFNVDGFVVRKLCPLECWRLQGFSDEDYYKAEKAGLSNSKLYERAGRGIVVPMLEEIFKILFKEYIK